MEKKECGRKYELMAILDAKLPEEDKAAINKEIAAAIEKAGGRVINSQVWMEKHKLTFEINKCQEGTYYLTNFEGKAFVNKKIDSVLKLNERVLRFLIINVK